MRQCILRIFCDVICVLNTISSIAISNIINSKIMHTALLSSGNIMLHLLRLYKCNIQRLVVINQDDLRDEYDSQKISGTFSTL